MLSDLTWILFYAAASLAAAGAMPGGATSPAPGQQAGERAWGATPADQDQAFDEDDWTGAAPAEPDLDAMSGEDLSGQNWSDEALADEAVADEALADEGVVDEAPADEGVVDEAPADEALADEAPADEGVVDEAPADEGGTTAGPDPAPAAQAASEDPGAAAAAPSTAPQATQDTPTPAPATGGAAAGLTPGMMLTGRATVFDAGTIEVTPGPVVVRLAELRRLPFDHPLGLDAIQVLADAIGTAAVTCHVIAPLDGAISGDCTLEDGVRPGLDLVATGLAAFAPEGLADYAVAPAYQAAQESARMLGLGLWALPDAERPALLAPEQEQE